MPLPTLTFFKHPNKVAPVNAPMVWGWTASFSSTTATIDDSYLIADLKILDQNVSAASVVETVSRFRVPPRGTKYLFNSSDILKSYVTFPYDSATVSNYVNETTGFTKRLAPETEGVVRYQIDYGLEFNPKFTFQAIFNLIGVTQFVATGTNVFAAIGDIITISMDSNIYSYFNGTASITNIGTALGQTVVTTDMLCDPAIIVSAFASGRVTSVQHMYGSFPNYYGYNGTRQYFEKDTDFLERYGFQGMALQTFNFLNDYGRDSNHCIPIRPYQGERARCFMDFYGHSSLTTMLDNGLFSSITTYNEAGTQIALTSSALSVTDTTTGVTYSQSCFTVAVFNNQNTIPIVDGYKYKFKVYYLNAISATVDYAELWYIGNNKCSAYQNYRIKFLNKQGTWCYWNFDKDLFQTSNIERTEYIRPMSYEWTLLTNDDDYSTSGLRGNAILSSKVHQTFTLNTDWIAEDAYKFLAQLVESPEVFLYFDNADATTNFAQLGYDGYALANGGITANGTNIPLIITDSSYPFKTTNREGLFNLSVTFKYAFNTNLQNQ